MKTDRLRPRIARVFALSFFLVAASFGAEIKVMVSGAFTASYQNLAPEFERRTGNKIVTTYGASMGTAPNAIPTRLQRGETADVVILAAGALDKLVEKGLVQPRSRVDLVRSKIGMAVKEGQPKPDISTTDALRRTLLQAKSIAYSDSASGHYLAEELFPWLGIAEEIKSKCRRIEGERVGSVLARGEAEIGFQQISELLPVAGITVVGPLPPEAQRITLFSAGLVVGSTKPEAKSLIEFLASSVAEPAIRNAGLEPAHPAAEPNKTTR